MIVINLLSERKYFFISFQEIIQNHKLFKSNVKTTIMQLISQLCDIQRLASQHGNSIIILPNLELNVFISFLQTSSPVLKAFTLICFQHFLPNMMDMLDNNVILVHDIVSILQNHLILVSLPNIEIRFN